MIKAHICGFSASNKTPAFAVTMKTNSDTLNKIVPFEATMSSNTAELFALEFVVNSIVDKEVPIEINMNNQWVFTQFSEDKWKKSRSKEKETMNKIGEALADMPLLELKLDKESDASKEVQNAARAYFRQQQDQDKSVVLQEADRILRESDIIA